MTPQTVTPGDAQFVLSALAVLGIQKAKAADSLPWITHETDKLNRIVAIVLSLAGSIGINASFHAGVLTVSNLTWSTLIAAAFFFGRSLVGQELIYRVVKMGAQIPEFSTTLATIAAAAKNTPPSEKTA